MNIRWLSCSGRSTSSRGISSLAMTKTVITFLNMGNTENCLNLEIMIFRWWDSSRQKGLGGCDVVE